jgi:phosphoribosylformylglycinamidine synthase I
MSLAPRALVLNAPGINCNFETGFAIEQAGGLADQVHISQLRDGSVNLEDYQMLFLSGGFSHGDDIASGRILGLELRTKLSEDLNRFVGAEKAVVGICNGYQVLVESGLLPDGRVSMDRQKKLSLVSNQNNTFECRWGRLLIEDSVSRLVPKHLIGQVIELPSAHQEGRHVGLDDTVLDELKKAGQVVFRFVDKAGKPTEEYPDNPNGSPGGITGICDRTGVVLGLMPHPERAVETHQHPNWRRGEGQNPFGSILFKSIINYSREV